MMHKQHKKALFVVVFKHNGFFVWHLFHAKDFDSTWQWQQSLAGRAAAPIVPARQAAQTQKVRTVELSSQQFEKRTAVLQQLAS